ncbi:MAG: glucose 1-dehydrogenase [Pseudomonadales bacterium]
MNSILDKFRVDGQVAIVTGAGRGIGQASAIALADAGADVVVSARTVSQLEETAEQIRQRGRKALVVQCDATNEEQRQSLVEQIFAEFGRLDILVNNAGGSGPKSALDTTPEEFNAVLDFNCTSAFAMSRLAAPHMAKTGKGSIVNISSVAARFAQPGFAAYGVGKAAMDMLTRNLAQDFAPIVRVNAVAVGTTLTSALEGFMSDEMEAAMLEHTPLARLGKPEDIAACVLFLASPAADYVSGEIYGVNGGLARTPVEMPRANFEI